MKKLLENLFIFKDTCNVYVIKKRDRAVLIDFGNGDVLPLLKDAGIIQVTDILLTHHHRDQAQELKKAVSEGANIWVPHTEQDLFKDVESHWQAREVYNNYNMREDRFSVLYNIPIAGTLKDYETYTFANQEFTILPTPGHTIGSISIIIELNEERMAFTGDLIYAPGKVWSMAATQWSYNGAEGVPYSILSLLSVKDKQPSRLLPSHGEEMSDPAHAIDLLIDRLNEVLKFRKHNLRLFQFRQEPYVRLTPHLLRNRTSWAHSYVLLSETGKALLIDFGYDFMVGMPSGWDRASRRPWLYNIDRLKEDFGVEKIDVALPTHFHDDHVAGLNLLRDVEGTEVWAAENFSDILEKPDHYDLPCIWYDPIEVDKEIPLNQTFNWEEYEFTLHEQSGHTLYAVAINFEVDGKNVLAIGDQYQDTSVNYVYKNGFRIWDYADSAELYERIQPDLIISGHAEPLWMNQEILTELAETGEKLEEIHHDLLPEEMVEFRGDGSAARLEPYQKNVEPNESFTLTATVSNPYQEQKTIEVKLTAPDEWEIPDDEKILKVAAKQKQRFEFQIRVSDQPKRRVRIAADITIGEERFGQQAEALITIVEKVGEKL